MPLSALRLPAPFAVRMAAILLFAFPLFAVSVRHWASTIFYVLALLALWPRREPGPELRTEERFLIGIIAVYLGSTLISNTLSGWTNASVRWYEADFRFLLAIPIFLMLRAVPGAATGLLRAIPVAGMLIGIDALYQSSQGVIRVDGPYGPIFLGNIAALFAALSVATLPCNTYPLKLRLPLHVVGSAMALVATALSGTRSAWLAAAIGVPVAAVFALRGTGSRRQRRYVAVTTLCGAGATLTLVLILAPSFIQTRAAAAAQELDHYLSADTPQERAGATRSSAGLRLEQWRVGLLIFSEHALFGIGVGNVSPEINRRVDAGEAGKAIRVNDAHEGRGSHLHSAYFDALVFKGGVGLLALLLVLLYPIYLALQPTNRADSASGLLIVNGIAFGIFCLTEDPFIRNNFSSAYLVFLLCSLTLLFAEDLAQEPVRASSGHIAPTATAAGSTQMTSQKLLDYDSLYSLPAAWWLRKKAEREWFQRILKLRVMKRIRTNHLGLDLKIPLVSRLGKYLIVPNEFYMSKCIHAFLTLKPGAAIDVGTHAGEFLVRFKAACQDIGAGQLPYYGFEPNYASFYFINELIADNGWIGSCKVFPVALTDATGIKQLYASRYADPCGSIQPQINQGSPEYNTLVTAFHGDEFLRQLPIERLSMIKIDAEGAEAEILAGLRSTISEHRPFIHCEIANIPSPDHFSHAFIAGRNEALLRTMNELGYQIYTIQEDGSFYHRVWRRKPYRPTVAGPISQFEPTGSGAANYFMAHADDAPRLLEVIHAGRANGGGS